MERRPTAIMEWRWHATLKAWNVQALLWDDTAGRYEVIAMGRADTSAPMDDVTLAELLSLSSSWLESRLPFCS